MKDREENQIILIMVLFAMALGFILGQAIYDDRPITEEEYYELQKTEWYE